MWIWIIETVEIVDEDDDDVCFPDWKRVSGTLKFCGKWAEIDRDVKLLGIRLK